METTPSFGTVQLSRLSLRAWLMLHGVASAVFWTLFFIGWTLLVSAGYEWVGWLFLVAYVVIASPVLILQAVLIADLLAYVVIGKIFAFPAIDAVAKEYAAKNPEKIANISVPLHLFLFFFDASPLSSLALWSMVVLDRMPEAAHARLPLRDLKRKEIQFERAVYATATARLGFVR
jgi:hypothetical protein